MIISRTKFIPILFGFFLSSQCFAEDSQLKIHRILINSKNVFETGSVSDRHFPYSWANKIHIVTKESYIRSELLFKEGDVVDSERLQESERFLRRRPIFRYVKITTSEPVNGEVDVLVETEDVWTTTIHASYSVAGGENSYSLGILEQNFLGLGKTVGAFMRKDIDRTTRGLSYRDPVFLHTRWDLFGGYGRDEKGREWETHLERPFFSALTRHSEGVSFNDKTDEDRLFENGDEVANFQHHTREVRMFGSYALVAKPQRVRRVTLAQEWNTDEFSDPQGAAPDLPSDRRVNPLLLGADCQNIEYHKMRGVTTFDRDEDINMGWVGQGEIGPSPEKFGATQDAWVGRLMLGKNFHAIENQVWLNAAKVDGRMEHGGVRDGVLRVRNQYYLMDWLPKHTFTFRSEYTVSKNLDPEDEFLLGGENGLRGYSVRQFSGSSRVLFTLENRRAVLYDWLHLVSMGWAVFADAGAVWEKGPTPSIEKFRSDVGAGLRLAPSRSVDPGLVRIDVAYALQDNDRKSRFVLNIGADLSFGERRVRKFDQ